jgi:hypothetical protein
MYIGYDMASIEGMRQRSADRTDWWGATGTHASQSGSVNARHWPETLNAFRGPPKVLQRGFIPAIALFSAGIGAAARQHVRSRGCSEAQPTEHEPRRPMPRQRHHNRLASALSCRRYRGFSRSPLAIQGFR